MAKHTPVPWEIDGNKFDSVAFIVRAVNCHEELVEALRAMLDARTDPMGLRAAKADEQARAALRKAEEVES